MYGLRLARVKHQESSSNRAFVVEVGGVCEVQNGEGGLPVRKEIERGARRGGDILSPRGRERVTE